MDKTTKPNSEPTLGWNKINFFLLVIVACISGASSCADEKTTPSPDEIIVLAGTQSKDITIQGNKYTFSIAEVNDNRCFMSSTSFGDYGLRTKILVKSQQNCKNDTCSSSTVELFLPNCDGAPIDVTDLFSDSNQKRGVSSPVFDFLIGISDATPHQIANAPKKYTLSDYELKLFAHKP